VTDQKTQWTCYAYGCPMHASVKIGGDEWTCAIHGMAGVADWQEITAKLNERKAIVRYFQHALKMDPFKFSHEGSADRAAEALNRIGRPDLAPRAITLHHKTRDKVTGAEIVLEVQKDERQSLPLWIARLHATLARECAGSGRKDEAKKGDTWANAAGLVGYGNDSR